MDGERARVERLHAEGRRAAVATVVHVAGSAYRHEGARLVVDDRGETYGAISGGCLEGDVREVALRVLAVSRPELVRYDLTADDDAVWGLGLGCNGTIDVYVEPAEAWLARSGVRGVVATVVAGPEGAPAAPGARLVLRAAPDGAGDPDLDALEGTLGHPALDAAAAADARRVLAAGRSRTVGYRLRPDGSVETVRDRRALLAAADAVRVFFEVRVPPPPLLVFGAGHDAVPLVHLAHLAGFRVVVVDPRPAYLTRERFPEAEALILCHPEDVPGRVPLSADACAVIMTHNFRQDLELLRVLGGRPLAYLGLLGPRERTDRLFAALAADGLPAARWRERLHSPVGLDIGAEGPEQIALAVVAEALAVRNGRAGGFLRRREGPLHPERRTEEEPGAAR